MNLTLKRHADGRLRPCWYGDFVENGKRKVATLCEWRGEPPSSGSVSELGDPEFEASRQKARVMLEELVSGEKSKADKEVLLQRIHRARYGTKVESVALSNLKQRWDTFPRRRQPGNLHRENCHRIIDRMVAFVRKQDEEVQDLGGVTAEHLRQFMEKEADRGVTARTWNVSLTILRSIFKRLEPFSDAWRNYLAITPTREEEIVHREPFTEIELGLLLKAAEGDPLIRKLVVVACCTAMRRGDVCQLRWEDIDLTESFITVKTSKTGGTVDIPILPALRSVLLEVRPPGKAGGAGPVFPEASALYRQSPHIIDHRLRVVMERAGFVDVKKLEEAKKRIRVAQQGLKAIPLDQLRCDGLAAIADANVTEKRRDLTRRIFELYLDGKSVNDVSRLLSCSKGLVSTRLRDVELMTGAVVIRAPQLPQKVLGAIHAPEDESAPRAKRGSLKGWHSFRTTWITLALSAGVPMELVCRVTGHATVDVVTTHYFRPGRAQFKKALNAAMPALLQDGVVDARAKAIELLSGAGPRDWRAKVRQALELLDEA